MNCLPLQREVNALDFPGAPPPVSQHSSFRLKPIIEGVDLPLKREAIDVKQKKLI